MSERERERMAASHRDTISFSHFKQHKLLKRSDSRFVWLLLLEFSFGLVCSIKCIIKSGFTPVLNDANHFSLHQTKTQQQQDHLTRSNYTQWEGVEKRKQNDGKRIAERQKSTNCYYAFGWRRKKPTRKTNDRSSNVMRLYNYELCKCIEIRHTEGVCVG